MKLKNIFLSLASLLPVVSCNAGYTVMEGIIRPVIREVTEK